MPQSKFNEYISEMDSTLWPIPGQEMNNRSVVYKSLPSIAAILQQPPDTDATGIIGAAPAFGQPLQHIVDNCGNFFESLQTIKTLFIEAKANPVYQGRERQQKELDALIEKTDKIQKFFFKQIVEKLDGLSLSSLGNNDNTPKDVGTTRKVV